MRDQLRKLGVLSLFCAAVAGVWTLGAVKAELDRPVQIYPAMQADPSIAQAGPVTVSGADDVAHEIAAARSRFYAS